MELDIATKKNKLKLGTAPIEFPEINQLFDLYWGGPERRITGLTLRIMAVNSIALVMLMLGIIYLGQYQNSLIEAKLETFKSEIELVSSAISQSAIHNETLDTMQAKLMVAQLSKTTRKKILLFNKKGELIANSYNLLSPEEVTQILRSKPVNHTLQSVQTLKNMAKFITSWLPDNRPLLPYPSTNSNRAKDYPNAQDALNGQISLSVWSDNHESIILSASAPLRLSKDTLGVVLLTRDGSDIERAIANVWTNILKIFLGTLIITTMLSIYLSGTIARPLRKLAQAAEAVRASKGKGNQIPDLSARNDEIGELSLVLRDMTQALWDRMDLIEQFAADVSHELKNPLTSLRSAIETAVIVKKKSDQKKLFEIIMHDLERLDRLISDISNASRLDTELSREPFKPVNIENTLRDLINIHNRPLELPNRNNKKANTPNISIELDIKHDGKIYVWGLEGRIHQVFDNLISNAMSFSPKGGAIKIQVHTQNSKTFITVSDQGPGIPATKLDTIFDRFYSERPQHEDYGHHSGLGLSICKQIINAHKGAIFAENLYNNGEISGAIFTVILSST